MLALPKANGLFSCMTEAGWGLGSRGVRGEPFKCLLPYKSQVPLLIPRAFRPRLLFPKGIQKANIAAHHPCSKLAAPITEHGEMVGATVGLVLAWDGCGDVSGHSDSAIGNVPRMLRATFPLCHDLPGWPEPRLPAWDSGDSQHTEHQVTPWAVHHSPTFPTHSRHCPSKQPQCSPRRECSSSASIPTILVHPPSNRASLTPRGPCVRPWFASPQSQHSSLASPSHPPRDGSAGEHSPIQRL